MPSARSSSDEELVRLWVESTEKDGLMTRYRLVNGWTLVAWDMGDGLTHIYAPPTVGYVNPTVSTAGVFYGVRPTLGEAIREAVVRSVL